MLVWPLAEAVMSTYELAQLNIGIVRGPMDSPIMAEFSANLDRINALAESSPDHLGDEHHECPRDRHARVPN